MNRSVAAPEGARGRLERRPQRRWCGPNPRLSRWRSGSTSRWDKAAGGARGGGPIGKGWRGRGALRREGLYSSHLTQ